jgi:hypothetical protein
MGFGPNSVWLATRPGQSSPALTPASSNFSPLTETNQANYVQLNQTEMDRLYGVGVLQPDPINGPANGEPQYLVPQDIYAGNINDFSLPYNDT